MDEQAYRQALLDELAALQRAGGAVSDEGWRLARQGSLRWVGSMSVSETALILLCAPLAARELRESLGASDSPLDELN